MNHYQLFYFAAAYGEGDYNTSVYSDNSTTVTPTPGTTTPGGTGGTSGGGTLANTGFELLVVASVAAFLVFIALLVRFWKRSSKKAQPTT